MKRRQFFSSTSALAAIAASSRLLPKDAQASPANAKLAGNPICVFAKHVQALDYEELGRRLHSINADGIEATLRKGGQIEPKQLPQELGDLVDALSRHDQKVVIAASDVNEVNKESEQFVSQLAKYSIPFLRMKYYKYDFSKPILPQLKAFETKAKALASLCEAHNVTALYQNHAGKAYVGAALWDLGQLMQGIESKGMAVAVDIRHTTLELTQSYEAAYRAIRSRIGATYIKDYEWIEGRPQNVPLGEGRAKPFFDIIKKDGFVGPLSLHMEYTNHRDPSVLEESWRSIEADMNILKKWLTES